MIENNEEKNDIFISFDRLAFLKQEFKTHMPQHSHAITATNRLKTVQKKANKRECD